MFKRVLVANRGEIAVRAMRTFREMGISPIAVYSEVDQAALHVRSADRAIHIGPAPARESYLVAERIIDAAKEAGAEAIYPGLRIPLRKRSICRGVCGGRRGVHRSSARGDSRNG
jgi:acetyl/propionyl-CoA carboxylase alpha subunit